MNAAVDANGELMSIQTIHHACEYLQLDSDIRKCIFNCRNAIIENPNACRFASALYKHFFYDEPAPEDPPTWRIPQNIGTDAMMFYAVVFLSGLPHLRALHQSRGIPDSITQDTLSDLALWIRDHERKTGQIGLGEMKWLVLHFTGKLYKIRRLQFELTKAHFDIHVFRRKTDGRILLLAGDGQAFRNDGQFADADKRLDPTPWHSAYSVTSSVITGNPITTLGVVKRQPITLQLDKWEHIACKGSPAIGVHIPATGAMNFNECGASFSEALRYLPVWNPEHHFDIFTCDSWLLDPQLGDYLPAESNLVRFLREWYLYPVPGASSDQMYMRVFGDPNIDFSKAVCTSLLQTAVVQHVKSGKSWRTMGGVLLKQPFQWGSAVNRARTDYLAP